MREHLLSEETRDDLPVDKIRRTYDSFTLDKETRNTVLNNLIAASSSGNSGGNMGGSGKPEAAQILRINDPKEENGMKNKRYRRFSAVAAGILGGILLLTGVAYAAGWIGRDEVQMEPLSYEYDVTVPYGEDGRPMEPAEEGEKQHPPAEVVVEHRVVNNRLISLVGRKGSPEFEACQEWFVFEMTYNLDHLDEIPNDPRPADYTYYDLYDCWNQEMRDKLDEILNKYGLEPHHTENGTISCDVMCEAVGIERIFPDLVDRQEEHPELYQDYRYYDDGSFSIERAIDWTYTTSHNYFRLDRYVYGTLTEVIGGGDLSDCTEWHYTTKAGIEVTAFEKTEPFQTKNSRGEDVTVAPGVRFFIDRPESFVTLSIGYEEIYDENEEKIIGYDVMTHEQLEDFLENICLENIP